MPILTPPGTLAADIRFQCDACGLVAPGFPPDGGRSVGVYVHASGDRTLCRSCADEEETRDFAAARSYEARVSSAGDLVTWQGHLLARQVASRPIRLPVPSWAHGERYASYRFRAADGSEWYGRGSPGLTITVRRAKA